MTPQIVYLAYALLWFRGLVPRNALASAEPPRRIGGGSRRWPLAIPVDTLARQTRSWCYGDFTPGVLNVFAAWNCPATLISVLSMDVWPTI